MQYTRYNIDLTPTLRKYIFPEGQSFDDSFMATGDIISLAIFFLSHERWPICIPSIFVLCDMTGSQYADVSVHSKYILRNMYEIEVSVCLLWFGAIRFHTYPSRLFHWHWGNQFIAPQPVSNPKGYHSQQKDGHELKDYHVWILVPN